MTTTLLAVDDSKTMRKVLEITFAGEDYNTVLAESSADALAKVQANGPAIALVDAGLGNESGYDLCQQIKAQSPATKVIILSSKHAPYDAAKGSAVGADEHHDKPFDTQQLIDKVSKVVAAAAAQPAAAAPAPAAAPKPAAPALAATPRPAAPAPAPAAPKPATPAAAPRSGTMGFGSPAPTPAARPQQPRVATPSPARTNTMPGTPAPARPASAPAPVPAAAPAPQPSAAAAAATAGNGKLAQQLAGLGLTKEQIDGVLALSREVVEQVVWEVVPVLAETMIKEEIDRLTSE